MANKRIKVCRIILVFCIIIPILMFLFEIIYRNDYKAISYCIIPIIIGINGLISSYSSVKYKE